MKRTRVIIAIMFVISMVAVFATQTFGYPPFLDKARKFGAKDCRFCHVKAAGGDPLAVRGKWLVKEKTRRNADAVDPEWLADYKPASKSKKK